MSHMICKVLSGRDGFKYIGNLCYWQFVVEYVYSEQWQCFSWLWSLCEA
jgi:hypothetical protein